MRSFIWRVSIILLVFAVIFLLPGFGLKTTVAPSVTGKTRVFVMDNIERVIGELKASQEIIVSGSVSAFRSKELIERYRLARKYYKQIEFFLEYYSPFESKYFINGPLVQKVEMEISSEPFPPRGFQVIEESLYDNTATNPTMLKNEYDLLITKFEFLKTHYATIVIEREKIFEALKLELIRIMCLTLNGYDCTINKEAVVEAEYSLRGIEAILNFFDLAEGRRDTKRITKEFKKAYKAIRKNPDSDSFDRLTFITEHLSPIYTELVNYGIAAQIPSSGINYAVNLQSPLFFALGTINKQFFSVYVTDTINLIAQADLGKLLFYDPLLSGNLKRSCASCHHPDKAFTDGLDKSLGYDASHKLGRNSPSLLNAAYQKLYFHDGRMFNLEGQAGEVFGNVFEMNCSDAEIVSRLKQSNEYRQMFRKAFKDKPDTTITFYAVIRSITEYIKTLDSYNSRFDKYLQGKRKALSADEKKGFNLFMGKALCGSCHFFPLFNGTVPPMYKENEFEVLGVPSNEMLHDIDPDKGREKITASVVHRFAFKTPGIRNIELTAPYMHNGAFTSVDSVLVFYNRGGAAGNGISLPNQTLPFDSLGLSLTEVNQLKKFLFSLTDKTYDKTVPEKLPSTGNTFFDHRRPGGEY
jgi:cytochrome c peroxidase